MKYSDLWDFIVGFEGLGEFKCVCEKVLLLLEMMVFSDMVLKVGGLVLLFEVFSGFFIFVLINFFGIMWCVVFGMGVEFLVDLRDVGWVLVSFKEFELFKGLKDIVKFF